MKKNSQFSLAESSAINSKQCNFLLSHCKFVLSHFGGGKKNSGSISLKFEVNSTLILPVKCPLTELEESQCYKLNTRSETRSVSPEPRRDVSSLQRILPHPNVASGIDPEAYHKMKLSHTTLKRFLVLLKYKCKLINFVHLLVVYLLL